MENTALCGRLLRHGCEIHSSAYEWRLGGRLVDVGRRARCPGASGFESRLYLPMASDRPLHRL